MLLDLGDGDGRGGPLDEGRVAFQEWDTCMLLAQAWGPFAFVDEALFTWHRHGNDTISGDGARNADGYAQMVEKHQATMLARVGRGALAAHYSQLATMNDRLGRNTRAWHFRCKQLWLSAGSSARAVTGGGDRVAVANAVSGGQPEEGIRVYG